IEPDPRVAEQLRKNVGSSIAQNVRVTAIGDSIGSATFHVNRDPQVSSLLPLGEDRIESFPDSRVVEKITVSLTTLDVLFGDIALAEPILLKIDVQGFEDRVITGSSEFLKRVQWVLMEVAFSKLYEGERDFESIVELLKKQGFHFVRPMNFHISPKTSEIIEMDALFQRT
ncbi:FkbM family methyltransferase, partial [Pseudomonadota bacterium]